MITIAIFSNSHILSLNLGKKKNAKLTLKLNSFIQISAKYLWKKLISVLKMMEKYPIQH